MTQLLFTMDKPSEVLIKSNWNDYIPYAFMVLDTSKELEEGTRIVYYSTKLDYDCNRGVYSFLDEETVDSLYEYEVRRI